MEIYTSIPYVFSYSLSLSLALSFYLSHHTALFHPPHIYKNKHITLKYEMNRIAVVWLIPSLTETHFEMNYDRFKPTDPHKRLNANRFANSYTHKYTNRRTNTQLNTAIENIINLYT